MSIQEKYERIEAENSSLKREIQRLEAEIASLIKSLGSSDFTEARGALFKRRPNGGFEPIAYCPSCKTALSTVAPEAIPMRCNRCKFMAPFYQRDIPELITELTADKD